MGRPPEAPSDLPAAARRHRALGSGTRLRILRLLSERRLPVSDIASALGFSVPTASRHLAILAKAGLVQRTRLGMRVVCRLSGAGAELLREAGSVDDRVDMPDPSDLRRADPEELELQIVFGASLFPHAARDQSSWNRHMIDWFGPAIGPRLPLLYAASVRICRGESLDGLPLPGEVTIEPFSHRQDLAHITPGTSP
jgi:DNA-binding transcriptional ArsR family regulator